MNELSNGSGESENPNVTVSRVDGPLTSSQQDTQPSKKKNKIPAVSDLLAASFWIYCLINIFAINTDERLQAVLPNNFSWIVDFKAIVILSVVAISWLILGTKQFSLLSIYILFFTLIILTICL